MSNSIKTVNDAVGLLIQSADIGIKSGIFQLKEVKYIVDAIEYLVPTYFDDAEVAETEKDGEPPVVLTDTKPVDEDLKSDPLAVIVNAPTGKKEYEM